MRRFFFHLVSPEGVERDAHGIECVDIERAYLLACEAIPDMAREILRDRKNPFDWSFAIENLAGDRLLTIPFTELIRSQPLSPAMETNPPVSSRPETHLQMAQRHVREANMHCDRQREIVAWERAKGLDKGLSEQLCAAFERTLSLHLDRLDYLMADQTGIASEGSRDSEL